MKHTKAISHRRELPRPAEVEELTIFNKDAKAYLLDYRLYRIRQYLTGGHAMMEGR